MGAVITDPDMFMTVTNNCLDKAYIYDFAKPWLGDGIITSSGAISKRSHKLLSPAFNLQVLNNYLEVFNRQSRVLIESFGKEMYKGPFDPLIHFARLAVESVCTVSPVCLLRLISKTVVPILTGRSLRPVPVLRALKAEPKLNCFNTTTFKQACLRLIRTKRSNRKKNDGNYNNETSRSKFRSFLDMLLEISESSNVLSDKQIKDEVETMMLAGHESLGYAFVAVIVILGSYQDVQQKAYEECKAVFGDSDRDVEKDDLLKLVYMEAVLMEVLRLYPVGAIMGRYIDSDIKVGDFTMKAGTSCVLSIYGVQRHPMWGPDANQFRPERWLDKASLPQHPAAYAAFSKGKRSCIGKTYAMMIMKTTIANILRRYHVTADHTQLVFKFNAVLQPESGHFITIRRRDNN